MNKVAVILNMSKEKAAECGKSIAKLLLENNCALLMPTDCKKEFLSFGDKIQFFDNHNDLFKSCDFAVTVGGDGTIIHCAKHAAVYDKPLIGINMGRLGFAAELEPDEICKLTDILKGNYKIQKRMLLQVSVEKQDKTELFYAVNDAVISRGGLSRIIDLTVLQHGEQVASYRADGLILSTPTGSTAYALSAGGPVIDTQMKCILLTPICPHSLYARSVVFDGESVISVLCESGEDASSILTVDGQTSIEILPEDKIEIKKADIELKLISLKEKNFYKLVNEKLKGREC